MTASAHEDDTHYVLTYVICRSVGFTHDEALFVAACDVAMDDWDNLVACGSAPGLKTGIQAHVDNEWMWHAIAPENARQQRLQNTSDILKQKNLLFQLALDKWACLNPDTNIVNSWRPGPGQERRNLFWLGVFFHYQQDTWAHRRLKPSAHTRKAWESYTTPSGHVGLMDGYDTIHEQDRPPWNPMGALRNLEDGIFYAGFFLKNVLNRQPNEFFTSVQGDGPDYRLEIAPWTDRRDQAWPRKTKLFNQITLVATTDAGQYLERLIRAQIEVYTNKDQTTTDNLGTGVSRYYTADQVEDVGKVLEAFTTVWAAYNDKLKLGGDFPTRLTFPLTKEQRDEYRRGIRSPSTWTSNDLVRDMGGWQDVLGFPSKTVGRLELIPNPPRPNRDLQNVNGPWRPASSDRPLESVRGEQRAIDSLLDVSAMNPKQPTSYELLAVGSNRMLYRKPILHGPWQLVPNSIGKYGVVAARVLPNGTILGVTSDFRLETKASLDPKDEWKVIENCPPGTVSSLTVKLDGTIVGVRPFDGQLATAKLKHVPSQSQKFVQGQGKGVLSEYLLEKGWQPVQKEKDFGVVALTVMPDQKSFMGVCHNGLLLYKSSLETRWVKAPNSNAFVGPDSPEPSTCALSSLATFPEGILGVRRFTFELLQKRNDSVWQYPDPDDQ
jgi:hypothetical protein